MNYRAVAAIYLAEMGRTLPHAAAKRRVAGDFDLALFRGVRRRDRLAHQWRSKA